VQEPTTSALQTAPGKMHTPLLNATVPNRLTIDLCNCKYTFSLEISSYRSAMTDHQCIATLLRAKCIPPLPSVAVQV